MQEFQDRWGSELLHDLDLRVLHLINDLAGQHWVLDHLVSNEETLLLLKGGTLLGLYWVFWFRRGRGDQQARKATIVAIMAGTLLALLTARSLAAALPFRERPIFDLTIGARLPSNPIR